MLQVDMPSACLPACNIPGNNSVVLVPCLHLSHWELSHLGCLQKGDGRLLRRNHYDIPIVICSVSLLLHNKAVVTF